MSLQEEIEAALSASPDYWVRARREAGLTGGKETDLPGCRSLPKCRAAMELRTKGRPAYVRLLDRLHRETDDTVPFRNAVYLLLYFDSLFVYRELKGAYRSASGVQRSWLSAACRKIIVRCLDVPMAMDVALTREIVRNTEPGRLGTTPMMVELSQRLAEEGARPVVVRDMAVSDGITTLDLAASAAGQGVPTAITGTDLHLYLRYAREGEDQAVSYIGGAPLQYEMSGETFGLLHDDPALASQKERYRLDGALSGEGVLTVPILAPEVEVAVESGEHDLCFKEEDAFDPDGDIAQADVIRVANLFVERTADHRGYYYRDDILQAIRRLGEKAKDGAYLYLDDFLKKTEHIGLWRKSEAAGRWERLPVSGNCREDLEGVTDIRIVESI